MRPATSAASSAQAHQASDIADAERPAVRNDLNRVLSELKAVEEGKAVPEADKKTAKAAHEQLMKTVQYAPWWCAC